MHRERHGSQSERAAAAGLLQIREQRVHHLHDGPSWRAASQSTPGDSVQNVGGDGRGCRGGSADCLHYGAVRLPEHVHIAGAESRRDGGAEVSEFTERPG